MNINSLSFLRGLSVNELYLSSCKLANTSVLEDCKNVKWLDIMYIDLTEDVVNIVKSLTNLERLSFTYSVETHHYLSDIQKALPNCQLIHSVG